MTMTANKTKRFGGFWDNRTNKCIIEMKGTSDGSIWFAKLFGSANVWEASEAHTMFCSGTPMSVATRNFPATGDTSGKENRLPASANRRKENSGVQRAEC